RRARCVHASSGSSGPLTIPAARTLRQRTKKRVKRSPRRKRNNMPREIITLECTEARKEGKSPSRYTTNKNKKLHPDRMEIKKFNPALRRHTVHKEIK